MKTQSPLALIVDDNVDNVEMFKILMTIEKFKTGVAYGGIEAIDWLKNHDAPDIIILDINMPDIDGRQVYEKIRLDTKFDRCFVVIVTANSLMVDEMLKIIKEGDSVLQKPFQIIELQQIVQSLYQKLITGKASHAV